MWRSSLHNKSTGNSEHQKGSSLFYNFVKLGVSLEKKRKEKKRWCVDWAQNIGFIFLISFLCPLNSSLTELFMEVQSSQCLLALPNPTKPYLTHTLGLDIPSSPDTGAQSYSRVSVTIQAQYELIAPKQADARCQPGA